MLNKLRDAIVTITSKSIDLLTPPVYEDFVAANVHSLEQLLIQEILAYQLPVGQKGTYSNFTQSRNGAQSHNFIHCTGQKLRARYFISFSFYRPF